MLLRGSRGSRAVAGLLVCGALLVAGCGTDEQGGAPTSVPTSTDPPLPTGFDACDLPQSAIDAEGLKKGSEDNNWSKPGLKRKWKGCRWIQPDGYAAGIAVTTITVQQVRESSRSQFTLGEELTIGGRPAITYWQPADKSAEACTLNVEMKGGGLEIGITNPPSRRKSKDRNACEIATTLAEMLVPAIPPGS